MADYVIVVLRYLHILFAILWIGALGYAMFVIRSAMGRVAMPARKETMRQLIPVAIHFIPLAAVMTIGLGALLYLVMGNFNLDLLLGTRWGQFIFVAMILALALFTFGMTVVIRTAKKTLRHLQEEACTHAEEMGKLSKTFNRGQIVALAWGFVILVLMVSASQSV